VTKGPREREEHSQYLAIVGDLVFWCYSFSDVYQPLLLRSRLSNSKRVFSCNGISNLMGER